MEEVNFPLKTVVLLWGGDKVRKGGRGEEKESERQGGRRRAGEGA